MPVEIKELGIKTPSPAAPEGELVQFEISIEEKPVDQTCNVLSIEISTALHQPDSAILTIAAGEQDDAVATSGNEFELGRKIAISVGYSSAGGVFFSGTITTRSLKMDDSSNLVLVITCTSESNDEPTIDPDSEIPGLTWGTNILDIRVDQKETGKSGMVVCPGTHLIATGHKIRLAGLAPFANETVSVKAVNHVIRSGQWVTTADF